MNYNPTVDYRSDRGAHSQAPNAGREPRSRITEGATRVALFLAVAVWAAVGFFIWVPLLLRRIVTFVVELTYVTLANGDPDPAAKRLRGAAGFYRRGFVTAVESVLSPQDGATDTRPGADRADRPDPSVPARPVLQEVAWALVVWYPVLLWLGIAELTPADVWNAGAAVPWQEMGADLVRGAVGWVEELAGRLGM